MKAFFYVCLSLFLLLTLSAPIYGRPRPQLVVEIFRNGARQPVSRAYNPFNFSRPGELTPLGLRQQYNLGLLMQKKYSHLFGISSPVYIYAESYDSSNSRQSVEAQILGALRGKDSSDLPVTLAKAPLVPVFADKQLVEEVMADIEQNHSKVTYAFHPIFNKLDLPGHFSPLSVNPKSCDYLAVSQKQRKNDDNGAQIYEYLSETVSGIKKLGYKVDDIVSLARFGDALEIMYLEGRNEELPEELRHGTTMYQDAIFANQWYLSYYLVGDKTERAIRSTGILNQIITWFQGKVHYYNAIPLKFAFMSGDEGNLLALLSLYNIVNHDCLYENHQAKKLGQPSPKPHCIFPKYASQIIFEFHKTEGSQKVLFLYNGKPLSICTIDDEYMCQLNVFTLETQTLIQNLSPKLHDEYCQIKDDNGKGETVIAAQTETQPIPAETEKPKTSNVSEPVQESHTNTQNSSSTTIEIKEKPHGYTPQSPSSANTNSPGSKVISSSTSSAYLSTLRLFVCCVATILVVILLLLIYRAVIAHKQIYHENLPKQNGKEKGSRRSQYETASDDSPHPEIAADLEQHVVIPDNLRLVMS